ncbi:indolepyruvate ferredoxin oxidoreductase beta subunit [Desulfitispora alkaliphila]|uniref:indolepyruvate oxidoreductase subunit beta n=1 Tax=Desulfitispora alkaliphila TaxID=622674 RepID=UPI003D24B614
MNNIKNVLLVGVGGQGTILASKILSRLAVAGGYDVKMNEIHGMAQRGGSVVTHVRFGDKVYSPIVDMGEADVIVAFEELEAMRWLPYLKQGGTIIVNSQQIHPSPVAIGKAEYPGEISSRIATEVDNAVIVNALDMAKDVGSAKVANVVLLGVLANYLDIPKTLWETVLEDVVPEKFLELNRKALHSGINYK